MHYRRNALTAAGSLAPAAPGVARHPHSCDAVSFSAPDTLRVHTLTGLSSRAKTSPAIAPFARVSSPPQELVLSQDDGTLMPLKFLLSLLLLLPSVSTLAQAPVITKIDPPNWWAPMPDPMLLVRGENLTGAIFTVRDSPARIAKTQISPNGHWAMLDLALDSAKPGTLRLEASTPAGTAFAPYVLTPRQPASAQPRGFSPSDVMYLIMTDRFADGDPSNDGPDHAGELTKPRGWHGGDLRGITNHLDYLHDLGITTVWITPVYANAGEPDSYHGYGATDMYAVDPHFGSIADLQILSAALHARGMKLVLDTVPNHLGPAHPWVNDSPTPDWFHGTLASHRPAQGDFNPLNSPHAPWRDQRDVLEGWFANVLPDLNQENPAVAQYLWQNAAWWVETAGLDGLRIDTFPYIARPFWRDFHAYLKNLFPRLTDVGEIFNGDPTVTSSFAGGVIRNGIDTGLVRLPRLFRYPRLPPARQTHVTYRRHPPPGFPLPPPGAPRSLPRQSRHRTFSRRARS